MAKNRAGKKKKRVWLWLLIIALAVTGYIYYPRQSQTVQYADVTASIGSIVTWYSFEGDITAPRSQSLTSPEELTVRAVYVQEGQHVEKNERLMRLSSGDTLKADIAGEVSAIHVDVDDIVSAGGSLIDIIDMSRLEVAIRVDEYDVPAIETGKSAVVTINALDKKVDCVVLKLDKQAVQDGQTSYYTATLNLPDSEGVLPGMQVEAKLTNKEARDVVILPMSALSFNERNEAFVLMQDNAAGQTTTGRTPQGTTDATVPTSAQPAEESASEDAAEPNHQARPEGATEGGRSVSAEGRPEGRPEGAPEGMPEDASEAASEDATESTRQGVRATMTASASGDAARQMILVPVTVGVNDGSFVEIIEGVEAGDVVYYASARAMSSAQSGQFMMMGGGANMRMMTSGGGGNRSSGGNRR